MRADLRKTGWTVLLFYIMFMILSSVFILLVGESSWAMLGSLIAVLISCFFIFKFVRTDLTWEIIFETGTKKMGGRQVLFFIICLFGAQIFFSFLSIGIEQALNFFGMSIQGQIESATASESHPLELFYIILFGPIVEELIFRGAVLQTLKKYGKSFAIFVSAFLFAFYHANLPQGCFAFVIGILFAYITVEYSIYWSILIHIFNNFYTTFLNWFIDYIGENGIYHIVNIIYTLCLFLSVICFFLKRREIREYRRKNRAKPGSISLFFRTGSVVVFLILNSLIMLEGIL